MARRSGRDLFEVLGARAGGGGSRSSRSRTAPLTGVSLAPVVDWLRGLLPSGGRRSSRSSRAGRWSGLLMAAVAFVVFGAGFLVGRGTVGGDHVEAGELRRGATPEWLGSQSQLSREQEEEVLSTFGFVPVWYPAPDRQRAARVAAWLRDQGLSSTRLRPMQQPATKDLWYFVVCYTDDASGARERATLDGLEAPEFAPELRERLAKLPQTPKQF